MKKIFIIAEIGINHNGNLGIARDLIDVAVDAGADAVKFQKRTIDLVYTQDFLDGSRESPWGTTQREQKEGLEFGLDDYTEIDKYCKEKGIEWFASAWDLESQKFLKQFGLKYNKIASAMIVYEELLKMIANEEKHTFISTGMTTYDDIQKAIDIFKEAGCSFELMHTVSNYPIKDEDANLKMIDVLRKKFNHDVGYSGHETSSYQLAMVAVTLGATSIERHITLDRAMYGSDQAASLEKAGLVRMVRDIRIIDKILGDGKKQIWNSELPVQKKLRERFV